MPLKPCKECGQSVSTNADACPHCGVKNPAKAAQVGGCLGCGGLVVASMVVIGVVSSISNAFDQRQNRTRQDRAEAAAAQREEDLRQDFVGRGGAVAAEARALLAQGDHDAAMAAVTPFLSVADAPFRALRDSIREGQILAELRGVPASDAGRNARLYMELADLRPDVARYAERRDRYRGIEDTQRVEAERVAAIAARRAFAERYQRDLMTEWLEVRVTTSGAAATTLRLQYILFSEVWAFNLTNDAEYITSLRNLGFTRLEISDGYDFNRAYTLN